jgi:hypothetical protein
MQVRVQGSGFRVRNSVADLRLRYLSDAPPICGITGRDHEAEKNRTTESNGMLGVGKGGLPPLFLEA